MKRSIPLFALTALLALAAGCASTPGAEKKKIDKPIADTYVPLKGAELNHRYSKELEELRAWQDAKAAYEAEYEPEPGTITTGRSVPEDRIQEPVPQAHQASDASTRIEEDDNSLRIRESR